jgi:hypothetical protein
LEKADFRGRDGDLISLRMETEKTEAPHLPVPPFSPFPPVKNSKTPLELLPPVKIPVSSCACRAGAVCS